MARIPLSISLPPKNKKKHWKYNPTAILNSIINEGERVKTVGLHKSCDI